VHSLQTRSIIDKKLSADLFEAIFIYLFAGQKFVSTISKAHICVSKILHCGNFG